MTGCGGLDPDQQSLRPGSVGHHDKILPVEPDVSGENQILRKVGGFPDGRRKSERRLSAQGGEPPRIKVGGEQGSRARGGRGGWRKRGRHLIRS
ncbi:MAG: hypothetical protein EB079_06775 [Verrucomicrobia bacterium]|nr:hypothetical protein [Verrucomicrobiota bacterium]